MGRVLVPSSSSENATRVGSPTTRQAVAKHLNALETAGLISATTEGRAVGTA